MEYLEIIKVALDLLLVVAILYMTWRFISESPVTAHKRELRELQGGLQELISEASQSGKSLNDQLIRRQSNLEKLLLDFEDAERRLKFLIESKNRSQSIGEASSEIRQHQTSLAQHSSHNQQSAPSSLEPPSFSKKVSAPLFNIYGEEISGEKAQDLESHKAKMVQYHPSKLEQQIEIERMISSKENSLHSSINHQAALFSAPNPQLKRAKPDDPRLGVLGATSRTGKKIEEEKRIDSQVSKELLKNEKNINEKDLEEFQPGVIERGDKIEIRRQVRVV
jgi:hypothetical protein